MTLPNRFNRQPLFQQLRDMIANRITTGEWPVGFQLVSEICLAEQFGVSNGTVRKALDILESEGYLSRQQGRGTFVLDPKEAPITLTMTRIEARALLYMLPNQVPTVLLPVSHQLMQALAPQTLQTASAAE